MNYSCFKIDILTVKLYRDPFPSNTDHDTDHSEIYGLFSQSFFWEPCPSDPCRYPRGSGREGAAVVDDDQPAERSEGAAAGGPLGAEEHGRLAAREAAAADGAGSTTAGAGSTQRFQAYHNFMRMYPHDVTSKQ